MAPSQTRPVRLALPSKGRLEGETLSFLAECNLKVKKPNPRQYTAQIDTAPDIEVVFQRPRDIPRSVAAGDIDLGITGYDTVYDSPDVGDDDLVILHDALGYGECALAVAVPGDWANVDDLSDLQTYAAQRPDLRVATRHERATRLFFEEHGLDHIQIVSADGALEAAPAIGYADFISDITSTGTTLRENNLKPLADGTIIQSEAVLIASRQTLMARPAVQAQSLFLLELIEANLTARNQYMVAVNIRGENVEAISHQLFEETTLTGLQGPTIAPLITRNGEKKHWWSLSLIVSSDDLYGAVQQLRAIGGSGVVVTPTTYIFDEQPERVRHLQDVIQGKVILA